MVNMATAEDIRTGIAISAAARRLALEEAAKLADEFESNRDPDAGPAIAAAIRALADRS